MQTAEQILQSIVWRDDNPQTGNGLGTLKEVFPTAEILLVKNSKTGAKRATIMVKKDGKVTNLICSEALTPLVRDGRITAEHLAGFPIIFNDKQNSLYIGFPSTGWTEVRTITVKEFVPEAISLEEMI